MKNQACIVGIGETAYVRKPGSGMTQLGLQLQADAGLRGKEIDGIMPFPQVGNAEAFAANLGCENLRFAAIIHMGGAAPVASLQTAAAAVATGAANYVLIPGGWNGYSGSRVAQAVSENVSSIPGGVIARDFYMPFGFTAPPQWYAIMARRHMHEYGTTSEQLGCIAVAMRKHAQLNPNAVMCGKPMTLEDYLASPMLADPYRFFDCCIETDGAAAVVVTTPERARDLGKQPVTIMGAAAGQPYPADEITNRKDIFRTGLTLAAPEAFQMAGVKPSDVDFAQIYDCFTFEVLQQLEETGFCKRGEGGAFVEGRASAAGRSGRAPGAGRRDRSRDRLGRLRRRQHRRPAALTRIGSEAP
jgi:acetyl-CoA acetyltransferase